ncbi:hypothetical protein SAMN04489735_1003173 [Aneurinibacillus thermoaerophilus]|uniref:Uncharacterized protein n=1 Tax=Aneurinibacillus thermoaerophilus TaxID=143495 RepID=A0A1G7XEE4_ANETH|nr:hypothetical protein SAMN04489735_1003173 [Aneurinibacillus thermoaerophilus]
MPRTYRLAYQQKISNVLHNLPPYNTPQLLILFFIIQSKVSLIIDCAKKAIQLCPLAQ